MDSTNPRLIFNPYHGNLEIEGYLQAKGDLCGEESRIECRPLLELIHVVEKDDRQMQQSEGKILSMPWTMLVLIRI